MSLDSAIYARLQAIAAVTALVSDRVYPMVLEQDPTYPAIRYQTVSAPREHVMGGDTGEVHARVQLDCYALSHDGAKALAAAVIGDGAGSALSRWGGTAGGTVVEHIFLENEIDFYEKDPLEEGVPGIHRVMLDLIVHYAE